MRTAEPASINEVSRAVCSINLKIAMLLQILALVALAQPGTFAVDEDILEYGSSGTSAVLLTVAYLEQLPLFPNDYGMLRRIAYVETRDGTTTSENIWAVSEAALLLTQNSNHPTLNVKHHLIAQELNIDWVSVQWDELQRPLYSALAARLILFYAPERIPDNVEDQAQFWLQHYNTNGDIAEFAGAANELEGKAYI